VQPSILFVREKTTMLNGLVSALLVLAGGTCAVAGYVLGSWHQRRALEADLEGDLFAERALALLEDPGLRSDERPN
jgi:hypothetical protein